MEVLIAEDDYVPRLLLKKAIAKMDHEVLEAADGKIAWELFEKHRPNMVITDWMMPEMDGIELCKKIKSSDKKAYSYIMLLTAKDKITDLVELTKESDPKKTEENVTKADGTVIFSFGRLSSNAENALKFSKANKKPWLHIDHKTEKFPARAVRTWIAQSDISVLNVAGRSASKVPGLKKTVNDIIASILNQ
ncbi:MAG: response regulator [Desulfobacteraceae bacterium]|nr:response regulator [Desulfobacteraceae bacterium]